jgi:hypothetical protein
VSHVYPEEQHHLGAHELFFYCAKHAVEAQPRDQVLLTDGLLQLFSIIFKIVELLKVDFALLAKVLSELTISDDCGHFIMFIQINLS